MRAVSWNVNGLRAILKKGLVESVTALDPDLICLQETKVPEDQVPRGELPEGYHHYVVAGERKGYSGVGVFTRREPTSVFTSVGMGEYEGEGRLLGLEFPNLTLLNVYFPNGQASPERLAYKMGFYGAFLQLVDSLHSQGKRVVACGDVNTAHREIDLAHPKTNAKTSGFLPEERAWIDELLAHGMVDTFRQMNPDEVQYTWWDVKSRARDRNVGWRLDYFFISEALLPLVRAVGIHGDVMGSDHCPVSIDLDIEL